MFLLLSRTKVCPQGPIFAAENNGEAVTMHCDLKNVSAKAIEVDASTLPWNNADLFSVNAVAADGKVKLQQHPPPPVEIIRLSAPRAPVTITSGESLKGGVI